MRLYENELWQVSNSLLLGWKVKSKVLNETRRPTRELKQKIGLVWFLVRNRWQEKSVNVRMSEMVLFSEFAQAVFDSDGSAKKFWQMRSAEELAEIVIETANETYKSANSDLL